MKRGDIIAAPRNKEMFYEACKSNVEFIFDLSPSIENLAEKIKLCRENNKVLFLHIDLAEGIGKDRAGLKYIKQFGVDGVISTRTAIIKAAKEIGLRTVQRTFVLDNQSIENISGMMKVKPDMAEIMPGVISQKIIKRICLEIDIPIIAGGLIETIEEVEQAIKAGATAVSTGKKELWNKEGM